MFRVYEIVSNKMKQGWQSNTIPVMEKVYTYVARQLNNGNMYTQHALLHPIQTSTPKFS